MGAFLCGMHFSCGTRFSCGCTFCVERASCAGTLFVRSAFFVRGAESRGCVLPYHHRFLPLHCFLNPSPLSPRHCPPIMAKKNSRPQATISFPLAIGYVLFYIFQTLDDLETSGSFLRGNGGSGNGQIGENPLAVDPLLAPHIQKFIGTVRLHKPGVFGVR